MQDLRDPNTLLRAMVIALVAALVIDAVIIVACGESLSQLVGLAPGIAILVVWTAVALPGLLRRSQDTVADHRALARALTIITVLVIAAWYAGAMIAVAVVPTTAVTVAAVLNGAIIGAVATVLWDDWRAAKRLLGAAQ